ncbi:MAG: DUF2911 domain-containing protein [Nonlabens sp.]|nr:DUF2911 domain-containing protein [Nonlabens sp.]
MKKLLFLAAAVLFSTTVSAQKFADLDKSPMDAVFFPVDAAKRAFRKSAEPQIRVLYGRPALKGREVFPGITKYGEVWRAGANESTELLLMNDATIGGKLVKAGRYTIVITPTEKAWTIHINSVNDGWGSYGYEPEMDVVTTSVPVTMDSESVENLSMALYSPNNDNVVHLKIGWGMYRVEMPITMAK